MQVRRRTIRIVIASNGATVKEAEDGGERFPALPALVASIGISPYLTGALVCDKLY
jgi:hypothetical protein